MKFCGMQTLSDSIKRLAAESNQSKSLYTQEPRERSESIELIIFRSSHLQLSMKSKEFYRKFNYFFLSLYFLHIVRLSEVILTINPEENVESVII